MDGPVRYDFDGSVARITMDDGKVNVLSHECSPRSTRR